MTCFDVYLELGPAGECMTHIPSLPGCFARANTQEQALAVLPDAIRAYYAWLSEHGEHVIALIEPLTVKVVETVTGLGPFWRGSRAALFTPDRTPFSPDEMQVYFRRATYSRADLLNLTRALSDQTLDWKTGDESMSIREILRHIGNTEEWYISRLVDPATLPPEWEHDAEMPLFEFLEMERRTALERLRRLTERERAEVFYPARWTEHPDEPWTARKALRRFLEHEREHTEHIKCYTGRLI